MRGCRFDLRWSAAFHTVNLYTEEHSMPVWQLTLNKIPSHSQIPPTRPIVTQSQLQFHVVIRSGVIFTSCLWIDPAVGRWIFRRRYIFAATYVRPTSPDSPQPERNCSAMNHGSEGENADSEKKYPENSVKMMMVWNRDTRQINRRISDIDQGQSNEVIHHTGLVHSLAKK